MAESKIKSSFASGELSPTMFGRVDMDQYNNGVAILRNFLVDWRGGASNRPGTLFCGRCYKLGARLIKFVFSTTLTYMLEVGDGYIRFYTNGLQVLENPTVVSAITNANPAKVTDTAHGYSTGNEIVLFGINMPFLNGRNVLIKVVDANTYTLTDLFGNNIDSTFYPVFGGTGQANRVYTLNSPFTAAEVFGINYSQSANVLTLTHPNHAPYNLSQVTLNSFSLVQEVVGPTIQPPTSLTATPSTAGTNNYGYVITAINLQGTEESLPCTPAVASSAILDQTASPAKVINLSWGPPASGPPVYAYNIYKWGPVSNTAGAPPTVFGYIGQTKATSFQDANIGGDFSKVPNDFQDPFSPGQLQSVMVLAAGAGYTGSYVPLTITDATGTGAAGFAIVNYATGGIAGAYLTNGGKNYTNPTITAGAGGAVFGVTLGPAANTYPAVVAYVQQRRTFAAPLGNPQGVVMSQTGNYNNFNTSPVVADSDAININIASSEVDYVRSITPMSTGAVLLTSGGAFLVSGGTPGAPITPSNITATRQASHGSNNLPALTINYDVVYMQQKANTVRDLAFNFYLQSYVGIDRSIFSQHLFSDFNFVQWCWAQEPLKIVAAVRNDGTLLTMTYLPEQEVFGWARHDTQGQFLSVETVSEGSVDAIYVIVNRYINFQWIQYVERFTNRNFDCLNDTRLWFLDCALQYPQLPGAVNLTVLGDPTKAGNFVTIQGTPSTFADIFIGQSGTYQVRTGCTALYAQAIGGGAGASVWASPISPKSGGGGAYAANTAGFPVNPGQLLNYSAAVATPGTNYIYHNPGPDTWLGNDIVGSGNSVVLAQGAANTGAGTGGGLAINSNGNVKFDGGTGQQNTLDYGPGAGGGGAAGPNGVGRAGGTGSTDGTIHASDGKGGNGDLDLGGVGGVWVDNLNNKNANSGTSGTEITTVANQITINGVVQTFTSFVWGSGAGGASSIPSGTGTTSSVFANGGNGGNYGAGGGTGSGANWGSGSTSFGGTGAAGILVITGTQIFTPKIGDVIRGDCGVAVVTAINAPGNVTAQIIVPFQNLAIPNDPLVENVILQAGNWTLTTPVTTVGNLWHLIGKQVGIVADGLVLADQVVNAFGQIFLPNPASQILVGLRYTSQLQTLDLVAEGPNIQGKRKMIPACTIRVSQSRGGKIGRNFNDLVEIPGLAYVSPSQTPVPLLDGDFRVDLMSDWDVDGRVCIQQDYPMPLSVLAIIPEFIRGDTAN